MEPTVVAGATYAVHHDQGRNQSTIVSSTCHCNPTRSHHPRGHQLGVDDHLKGEWGKEGIDKYETEINHLLDESDIEDLLNVTEPDHDSVNTLPTKNRLRERRPELLNQP